MQASPWNRCVKQLRADLSEQQFNTWIRPLQAVEDGSTLRLLAPNRFVVNWINDHCLEQIQSCVGVSSPPVDVILEVGSFGAPRKVPVADGGTATDTQPTVPVAFVGGRLNRDYTFGEADAIAVVDLPDNVTMAAMSLAIGTTGSVQVSTTTLLTPEDIDEAAKTSVSYRPPGA